MDSSFGALVGPSVNLEFSVSGELPNSPLYDKGEKNPAARVTQYTDAEGRSVFDVDMKSGESVRVVASDSRTLPGGSSINIGSVLMQLGAMDVTVFAPIGLGDGGRSIIRSVLELGIKPSFFSGVNGTPRTLTVRDPTGLGSTLFCAKSEYMINSAVVDRLISMTPRVLVVSSVKPSDLHLVEQLFEAHARIPKVLVPHADLLRLEYRSRLCSLIKQTDVLQVNDIEAGILLGRRFRSRHLGKLADLGAKLTVVTMGARGSVARENGGRRAMRTKAEEVMVEDSSGAGDTHLAAVVYYRHLRRDGRLDTQDCLRMAAWIAGQKVRHIGSWQGIPSREQCEEKVRELARS